jgi:type III secretory pathway component EscU
MDLRYIILQVKVWEIFFKLSPLIVLISFFIFYYFNIMTWNIILYTSLVFLISIFITWWIWVLYVIAVLSIILYKSQSTFAEISEELKKIKSEIKSKKSQND